MRPGGYHIPAVGSVQDSGHALVETAGRAYCDGMDQLCFLGPRSSLLTVSVEKQPLDCQLL